MFDSLLLYATYFDMKTIDLLLVILSYYELFYKIIDIFLSRKQGEMNNAIVQKDYINFSRNQDSFSQ